MLSLSQYCQRKGQFILLVFIILTASTATAQTCSATVHCATGCCSQFGFCGTDSAHCGTGCLSTCDYKLGCDASNPCPAGTGCCSKFGFCGLGPDYCDPSICVANCDSKSYCDPGYGASGYAEVENCPLNVCCSKWGFCGLTEEFCGNKTVTRPSCSSTGSLQRVVGYYEGWASRRACDSFPPKDIPLGVYTHINFAFASINPKTFQVIPGYYADIDLYKQVTLLKGLQPDLKVFIAIGGWTFNDPGPTATTFSDLAGSIDNQNAFFTSLTSFLSTYNFDGVDIDWEYPEADDRSGRPQDFANFPSFIANLKSHLLSTGGRSGLSITLPASYWYLQHFDIVKLQESVDFFNIMTYDLHGLWDKGNKWVGNFLNAHTNLTEITTALDLLWRNQISPDKVNLGLAFYARTFTMTNPSCVTPGCLFESAGKAGLCTNSVGTLSNAEIARQIAAKSLTPTHYQDAAVKVITWDDQWVAYDDPETYRQKADFARSLCLGGVMVWALSQDSEDLASSGALSTATRRTSSYQKKATGSAAEPFTTVTQTMTNRQCRWSACGEDCSSANVGDNYSPIYRSAGTGGDNTIPYGDEIKDSSWCGSKVIFRTFCCPNEIPGPNCAHFYLNNGACTGGNPDSCSNIFPTWTEIGSVSQDCHNSVKGGYYQICCDTTPKSMALYNNCLWNGQPGKCDTKPIKPDNSDSCPKSNPTQLVASASGSGAVPCGQVSGGLGTDGNHLQHRDYCCKNDQPDLRWANCKQLTGSAGAGPVPAGRDSKKWCRSGCPLNTVRVAMDNAGSCFKDGGAEVWCCEDNYTYNVNKTVVDPGYQAYKTAINDFMNNQYSDCALFSFTTGGGGGLKARSMNETADLEAFSLLRRDLQPGATSRTAVISLLYMLLTGLEDSTDMMAALHILWDSAVQGAGHQYLALHLLKVYLSTAAAWKDVDYTYLSSQIPCNMEAFNSAVEVFYGTSNSTTDNCDQWTILLADPEFFDHDQDYHDSQAPITAKRTLGGLTLDDIMGSEEKIHYLAKRDGAERNFNVNLGTDANGNPIIIVVTSWSYPNGGNGQAWVSATGIRVRYTLDSDSCATAVYIETQDPEAVPAWAVEHIFELQTVARVLEFIVLRVFPEINSGGVHVPEYRALNPGIPAWVLTDWFQTPYEDWGGNVGGLIGRPDDALMWELGAKRNANHMALMDAVGNSFKANGWSCRSPVADDRWAENGWNLAIPVNGNQALSAIRGVLGTLSYLSHPTIDGNLNLVVRALYRRLLQFQTTLNNHGGAAAQHHGFILNVMPIWAEGVEAWGIRMDYFIRQWVINRIAQLRAVWEPYLDDLTSPLFQTATEIVDNLDSLNTQAQNARVNLDSFKYNG